MYTLQRRKRRDLERVKEWKPDVDGLKILFEQPLKDKKVVIDYAAMHRGVRDTDKLVYYSSTVSPRTSIASPPAPLLNLRKAERMVNHLKRVNLNFKLLSEQDPNVFAHSSDKPQIEQVQRVRKQ